MELILADQTGRGNRDPYMRIYGPSHGGPPWRQITAELVNGGILLTVLDTTDPANKPFREFYPGHKISAVYLGEEVQ